MSRWDDLFKALSLASDTVDTVDTIGRPAFADHKASHCVNSVMARGTAPGASEPPSAECPLPDRCAQREVWPPGSDLIAPGPWFERSAPPASGEPPFDEPCVSRRGRVEREGGLFLHFCITCGAWGAFGYGVTGDRPGRWYCREHQPRNEIS
jgi:hypothetical protein